MNTLTFLFHRARHQWRRLLTVALGVWLATTVLAAAPVIVDVALDFGLRRTLQRSPALAAHVRLTQRIPADQREPDAAAIRQTIDDRLGRYAAATIAVGSARPLFPWRDGGLVSDERIHLRFYDRDLARFERHVVWEAGGWPAADAYDNALPATVPVVIGRTLADAAALAVGDRLPLSLSPTGASPDITYVVSGILAARDPQDPYWFGDLSPLRPFSDGRFSAEYTVLLPSDRVVALAPVLFPDTNIQWSWHILLDHDALRAADAPRLAQRLAAWRTAEARLGNGTLQTTADATLQTYVDQAAVIRTPIALVVLIATALSVYYIVLINAVGLRRLQAELALLAGRGVSGRRMALWSTMEIAAVALIAALLAAPVARLSVVALTRWGPLAPATDPAWPVPLPLRAWLAAVTGAFISIAAALAPLAPAWRRSLQAALHQFERPVRDPWWMRAYVDVMLLLTGAVLAWRIRLTGDVLGAADGGALGGAGIDWLLLLAPVLLLIGTAVMLLRLFPLLVTGLAAIAARRPGLPAVLALRLTARRPHDVARLLLLLTLALALGLFATALDRTLTRNELERARYTAVGDLRLALVGAPPVDPPAARATTTWRTEGALGATLGAGTDRFDLLALDPAEFNAIATYRDDFAAEPVAPLVAMLDEEVPGIYNNMKAVPVPGRPERLALHVWVEEDVRGVIDGFVFDLKLRTAREQLVVVRLTPESAPNDDGWARLSGRVPALPAADYPLGLSSIWWRTSDSFFVRPDRPPTIDRLVAVTGANEAVITEFEAPDGWIWYTTLTGMYVYYAAQETYSGPSGLGLALQYQNTTVGYWYGLNLFRPSTLSALPVLVTTPFAAATGSGPGDVVNVRVRGTGAGAWIPLSARIVGVVDYFPTLDDRLPAGSMITLRDPLLQLVNAWQQAQARPNELIAVEPDWVQMAPLAAEATTVWDAAALAEALRANPLTLGLRAVSVFGAVVTTVLSLAGFTTHFLLRAAEQARGYAVLRALGLSVRQLYITLLIEQCLLLGAALLFGTVLGVGLSRLALANLPFNIGAVAARPPFVPVIDWPAIGGFVLALGITFSLALAVTTASLWRADLHRALRVGEE